VADTRRMLDYEKLDVYQCAVQHLGFVFKAIDRIPRGYAALVDQWRRAATSIPLNIAEAAGKITGADRTSRYAIARGEAMECGAVIDVVRFINVIPGAELDEGKRLVVRLVEMLTRLCRS
jgi:four helix bundle protein